MKTRFFRRFAAIGSLVAVLVAIFTFGKGVDNVEVKAESTMTPDEKVSSLFDTYYADGVYTKETSIYMTEEAVQESIQYFHAQSTVLERTTYYAGDALWMSRGDGTYSYYGTKYNADGEAVGVTNATANTALIAPASASVVLSGDGKESMENYYVTMHDFKEAVYSGVWTETNGVYSTTNEDVLDDFRQFTAPCILPTEGASNYLQFTSASVEEVGTTLVMKLYVHAIDAEGKLTTTDGLFSQATLTNDNKYVNSMEVLTSVPYYGSTPNIFSQITASDTGWIDVDGVARYGMGYGTFEEHTMFNKNDKGTSGSTVTLANWRIQHPKAATNVGGYYCLMIIEATEHCYAKFRDKVTNGGYFYGNVLIKKYNSRTGTWEVVKEALGVSNTNIAQYLSCDYQELNPGDKLMLGTTSRATDGVRNLDSCTYGVEIAKTTKSNPSSISDVKSLLLDTSNAVAMTETVRSLSKGNVDSYMSIGLLEGTKELPVAPGGANGWCGFTSGGDTDFMRVQFLADTKPDAFYYTYTAKRSGYIYIDQTMLTWNGDLNSNVVATVNGEEVYNSGVRIHVTDGLVYDKVAVYLHAGETLKVQVNHLSNPARSVFQIRNLNLAFVPCATEYALPDGYATLIDYLNA